MTTAQYVPVIWALFLVRCALCIVEQPLWEGFDEWAHFAAVQHVSQSWRMPDRKAELSPGLRQSICESPLPAATTRDLGGGLSHAQFRMLPPSERSDLIRQCVATIHPRQYEGQQPPLYYYLMAVPLALTPPSWPVADQALLIRALSSLLASTAIFSTALLAARVLPAIPSAAILCAMLVAVFPGLCLNICRVGNESLSLALLPLLLLALINPSRGLLAGLILGLALLTKAYALALTPLLFFCLPRWRLPSFAIAFALSAWWYAANLAATGTLSGEQLDVAVSAIPLAEKLAAIRQIRWGSVIDSFAWTWIWTGGWSFLSLRSWMYRIVELLGLVGLTGLIGALWALRRSVNESPARGTLILLASVTLLTTALAYHSLVIFLTSGLSLGMGWYAHALLPAQMILWSAGIHFLAKCRRTDRTLEIITIAAGIYALLDMYGVQYRLLPFYQVPNIIDSRPFAKFDAHKPNPGPGIKHQ